MIITKISSVCNNVLYASAVSSTEYPYILTKTNLDELSYFGMAIFLVLGLPTTYLSAILHSNIIVQFFN